MSGRLTVPVGASLTIEPGVVLHFQDRAALDVRGSLTANGTADAPLTFTSATSFTPGAWCGVGVYEGASAAMAHAVVRYAGIPGGFSIAGQLPKAAGVFCYRGNLSLTGSTIESSGGDGAYYQNDSTIPRALTLSGNTIGPCAGDGVHIDGMNTSDTAAITGNHVSGATGFAFRVTPSALGLVASDNTMNGNTAGNGVAVTTGSVAAATTLPEGQTYFVLGQLTVPSGTTLTLSQGDLLRFHAGVKLQVNGALYALGGKYNPCGLVADAVSPAPSSRWAGIGAAQGAGVSLVNTVIGGAGYTSAFQIPGVSGYRTASVFAYRADVYMSGVTIGAGGGDAIYWHNDAAAHTLTVLDSSINQPDANGCVIGAETPADGIAIAGNTISGVPQYPIVVPARRLPDLSLNSIAANARPAVAVTGGTLDRSCSLDVGGLYHFLQPMEVAAGATFTVGAGATLQFASDTYLDIFGSLNCAGTEAARVAMTSMFPNPLPGDWGGVGLEPGSSATLLHTDVLNAGQSGAFLVAGVGLVQAALVVNRSDVTATDLVCGNSAGYGAYLYNPSLPAHAASFTGGAFRSNVSDGIHIHTSTGQDVLSFQGITASGNGGDGIRMMAVTAPAAVSRLTSAGNTGYGLRLPAALLAGVFAPAFSGNAAGDYAALTGGAVAGDLTVDFPIGLLAMVDVPAGAALRLVPGGDLTGQPLSYLQVEGTLTAGGASPGVPIAFHAPPGAPVGSWGGVLVNEGGSASLTNVRVSEAGEPGDFYLPYSSGAAAGILAYRANLVLQDTTILRSGGDGIAFINDGTALRTLTLRSVAVNAGIGTGINLIGARSDDAVSVQAASVSECGGFGMSVPMQFLHAITGPLAFGGNAQGDGIQVTSDTSAAGTLARDATVAAGTNLFIGGKPGIAAGARLTLEAGVTARMGPGAALLVTGELDTHGAPERPVLFTAASPTPSPGYWGGIGFGPGSTGLLTGLETRYGGASFTLPGGFTATASLAARGAAVTLNGSLLRDGAGSLVALRGTGLAFSAANTTLVDNAAAPFVRLLDAAADGTLGTGAASDKACDFLSTQDGAVVNAGPASVSAPYCYWGAADGPGPAGSGAGISGAVDYAPVSLDAVNRPVALLPLPAGVPHGQIAVTGTAWSYYFSSAVLEIGSGPAPATYTTLSSLAAPVRDGTIGLWDTSALAEGTYTLRLTVTDRLNRLAVAGATVTLASGPAASGDVNGDGAVTAVDALMALRISAGLSACTAGQRSAGDVRPDPTGDGIVSLTDAMSILRKAMNGG